MAALSVIAIVSAGLVVGGALGGVFVILKIITRMGELFKVKNYFILLLSVFLGATVYSVLYLIDARLNLGGVALFIVIAFAGMFVGMLVAALAEVLEVIPVGMHRMKMGNLIKPLLFGVLAGKIIGTILYFLKFKG